MEIISQGRVESEGGGGGSLRVRLGRGVPPRRSNLDPA